MDLSKHLTKLCISILFHREGLGEKVDEAEGLVDQIYPDLWKVFRASPTDEDPLRIEPIKQFLGKYLPSSETGNPLAAPRPAVQTGVAAKGN
ncbi:MAG: hypothetical protein ACRD1O_11120 [Terriglobia bacterium]